MLTSLFLASQFLIGIFRRLARDAYYRSLGMVLLIILAIGTLYVWLVGKWPLVDALLYAVTTMSMNTPYGGPLVAAAGREIAVFHMAYTFVSVGIFLIFAMETGKTMLTTYDDAMKKLAERKARKAAEKSGAASTGTGR